MAALERVLEATVKALGYELVDFDLSNRGRTLRVFIDRPGSRPQDPLSGITVDDCERVTRQLQHVLPVEGIDYERMEVSSPGLDRVLKKRADFEKFAGHSVELKVRIPIAGRRRFSGVLRGMRDESVAVEVEGELKTFPLEDLDKARLAPKFGRPDAGRNAKRSDRAGRSVKQSSPLALKSPRRDEN